MKKGIGKRVLLFIGSIFVLLLLYLLLWPVPVNPQSWQAPEFEGYVGDFAPNQKLAYVELLDIGNNVGPESVAINSKGDRFAAMHDGTIIRLAAGNDTHENWVNTEGRPLGIVFDANDNLVVADPFNGLMRIGPDKKKTLLTNTVDDKPLCYINNADIASDGKIYFSDSSSKFCAKIWGGTYPASLLDIMEHGGHGRLLVYNPKNNTTRTLLSGLNFANGVALDPKEQFVLVVETSSYRIVRYWLKGPRAGSHDMLTENLPAFPDNLTTGRDGRFWVGFISPRSVPLDKFADTPFIRKIIQRLPAGMRPKAKPYGHVAAINANGEVVLDLQDPLARYPMITEAVETDEYLYLGSLFATRLGRLSKSRIGL
ncbi:MAG: SMP-30/gluconolactonase/LRE family protein [Deltaproteobacteria bacterium]|nr:SMP-30/gluconolactonase/LRE family protein [Deltaproteobacteria bacterium]